LRQLTELLAQHVAANVGEYLSTGEAQYDLIRRLQDQGSLARPTSQTKANLVVDRAALDDPDLIFKREGGGFGRLDRLFAGQLEQILDAPPWRSIAKPLD
jgi:hypothetical protein